MNIEIISFSVLFVVPLRLPWVVQFVVLIGVGLLFGWVGLFNFVGLGIVLMVLACCSVGLAAMGWDTGWAWGWAIGWCL